MYLIISVKGCLPYLEVEKDEEGMQAVKALGQRMAWLLKKLHG